MHFLGFDGKLCGHSSEGRAMKTTVEGHNLPSALFYLWEAYAMNNNSALISEQFDNQQQRTYNAKEVGEIVGYMLQSLGYSVHPMNLDNGIAQAIEQPLATPKRMTMTVKDVAQELNISMQTVRAMIKRGELPAFKVGRNYAISRAKFEKWVMQQGHAQEGEQREAG